MDSVGEKVCASAKRELERLKAFVSAGVALAQPVGAGAGAGKAKQKQKRKRDSDDEDEDADE